MSTIIDLMRHGQVDGKPALYGRTDIKASPTGMKTMTQNAKTLPALNSVLCSPLKRCADFARRLSPSLIIIDGLKEMDFGDWDGVPFDELNDHWDALHQFWADPALCTPPNGESLRQFHQRVVAGWLDVVKQCSQGHHLLVCHGGVIRMILAHLLNVDYQQGRWYSSLSIDYASITRIEIPDHLNALPVIKFINMQPQHAQQQKDKH